MWRKTQHVGESTQIKRRWGMAVLTSNVVNMITEGQYRVNITIEGYYRVATGNKQKEVTNWRYDEAMSSKVEATS